MIENFVNKGRDQEWDVRCSRKTCNQLNCVQRDKSVRHMIAESRYYILNDFKNRSRRFCDFDLAIIDFAL